MSEHRTFTVVAVRSSSKVKGKANEGGRFVSRTPAGAARKAGSRICRESKIKGQCSLAITLRETTRGSNHKEYTYSVKRVKDPVTVERDGQEITFNYKTQVKSMKH